MSDTLADLASWLPSDFLSGDTYHRLPYDFASSSSTESESEDDNDDFDIPGLTRRFTRSVSLQERPKIPHPLQKKRVFSGSPESSLNWNVPGPKQFHSSPATPFLHANKPTCDIIYAAAEQIARMNMNKNDGVISNIRRLGAPRPPGPPFSHHNHNYEIRNENEAFIRQHLFRDRVSGNLNNTGTGRYVSGKPVGLGQSAWPPHPVETQRRQLPAGGFAGKLLPVAKKGCAGTGVFLPRSYTNVPPEPFKKPVCSPANKNMDHIMAQPQATVYSRQHQVPPMPQHHHLKYAEMIMAQRQTAVMLPQQQQRHTRAEPRLVQPEVVLPQEWTY